MPRVGTIWKNHPYEDQLDFIIERPNIIPRYIEGSTVDSNVQVDGEDTSNDEERWYW